MKKFLIASLLFPFSVLAQYEAGYIELQAQGTGGTIRMGETAEVARFRLSNRTGKSIILNRFKLRNYGTADLEDSFENFKIENNGSVISSEAIVARKDITFNFDNVSINRGDSLVLSVVGRLIYAPSGKTIELGIRRQEDVQASLQSLDYFSLECRACEGLKARSKTLKAGGIYLRSTSPYRSSRYYGSYRRTSAASYFNRAYGSRTSTNTDTNRFYYRPASSQSYSPGSKDIRFFSTYINSKNAVQVEGVFLNLASGSAASDKNANNQANELADFSDTFSDFTLWVNNQRVDTTNDFTTSNGKIGLLFNSTFDIPGNAQLLLTGRITNRAVSGDKVKFSLPKEGLIDPVYLYNGASVNTSNINGGSTSQFNSAINEPLSISK